MYDQWINDYNFIINKGNIKVTVFSAPNYCREFENSGAMMKIDENLICSFQILKPMIELANININKEPNQQK